MQGPDGSGRLLVLTAAVLFIVSTIFPVAASLMRPDQVGRIMGVADVTLAVAVLGCAVQLWRRGTALDDGAAVASASGFQQSMWNLPLALLVVFFLAGDRVRWNVLLPGLAWRVWLLANVFPWALAVWRGSRQGR